MATVRGHRTHWIAEATDWAFWAEDTSLSTLEHNSDQLIAASHWAAPFPALEERYRFAIKFDAYSAPSWAGIGPRSSKGMALFISLRNKGVTEGTDRFECAPITSAWDDTTNVAGMRALTVGSWITAELMWAPYGQIIAIWFPSTAMSAHGIMFRARYFTSSSNFNHMANTFSTKAVPQMRYYYQYSPGQDIRVDATERADLAASTVNILNDNARAKRFVTAINILRSEKHPGKSNGEVSPVLGLPSLLQRKMSWPESWKLGTPAAGGLPVALAEDSIEDIRGYSVETVLTLEKESGETVELARQIQVAGDTKWSDNGKGEIELRSPTDIIGNAAMVRVDPLSVQTVNYDDEEPIAVILDAVMNCGAWMYQRWHYNDIAWLYRRFEGVFNGLTYSAADLEGKTVSDILADIGPMLGFALAQSADGCLSLFHPGVYRPSIRVHDIDEDDCLPGGCVVTDRGRDGMYGGVKVTSEIGEESEVYQTEYIPADDDWKENLFSLSVKGDIFDVAYAGGNDFYLARRAVGAQMSQRLSGRWMTCNLSLEKKGLVIDPGDQINLTCGKYEGTKTFLVVQGNISVDSGLCPVMGVHYPDYPGLHSTFQNDGVKGIWRWTNPVGIGGSPAETEFDPLDWRATDPPFVTNTSAGYPSSEILQAHYQGKCIGDILYYNSQLISDTSNLCDLIDICTIVHGDFPYTYANNSPAGWTVSDAADYVPIMWWKKASGSEAIMLAIDRSDQTSLGAYALTLNRLFIAYTPAVGAGPTAWSGRVNAPYGSMGGAELRIAGSPDLEDCLRPAAIAVAWKDTTIRLYIDGVLVGEETDANFDKADWTDLYIRGCDGAPGRTVTNITQCMIGCVRHIQTTGWIDDSRIMGTNGIDPYYP